MSNNKLVDLRKKMMERDFCNMNNMQKEAIFHTEGPLLILAGAGSGKTTVLVNRIANILTYGNSYLSNAISGQITDDDVKLIEDYIGNNIELSLDFKRKIGISKTMPWQILAITFTNKAAGELKERLSSLLGKIGDEIWASTFHSTCAKILRMNADRLGYTNHFTIYDTDDCKRLIKDHQKATNIDEKVLSFKAIMSEISHAKDNMLSPEEYAKNVGNDYRLSKIAQIYKMYQNSLKESDAMDFDDLLLNTVLLFQKCPDILEYYQNKFRYIMVDEYQDTNKVQYMFIKMLAQKHNNLCVVGDDDQSIYKFRGATIENILNFEHTYPDATVIRLEQNYRSTQNILDAANSVISNNQSRREKTLWTENGCGDKISVHTAYSEHDEANYITDAILEGVANGKKYTDFAVLYRMNSQSNTIEKVFVKSGIPYRIIGGFRFYERKEIRDMIAYLNVINNPSDEVRLRRIINQPKRSIGDKTVLQALEIAKELNEDLYSIIKRADEFESLQRAAVKLRSFCDLIDELIEASNNKDVSLRELYQMILDKTNYIEYIKADNEENEDRIENINELASNIIKYEEDNEENASLSGFLEEVSLMTDIDNYDDTAQTVTMMTMHSAKGLEFPVVFLPGFEEGIFPGIQAIYNPAEIEEERRLAYVAITRSKEKLYILNSDSRMLFGSTSKNKISRFVSEINEDIVERTKSRDWKKVDSNFKIPKSEYECKVQTTKTAKKFGRPDFAKPSNKHPSFNIGDKVKHKVFGEGFITSVTKMSNDNLLEISFDKVGNKKLMSNFAKLEIV